MNPDEREDGAEARMDSSSSTSDSDTMSVEQEQAERDLGAAATMEESAPPVEDYIIKITNRHIGEGEMPSGSAGIRKELTKTKYTNPPDSLASRPKKKMRSALTIQSMPRHFEDPLSAFNVPVRARYIQEDIPHLVVDGRVENLASDEPSDMEQDESEEDDADDESSEDDHPDDDRREDGPPGGDEGGRRGDGPPPGGDDGGRREDRGGGGDGRPREDDAPGNDGRPREDDAPGNDGRPREDDAPGNDGRPREDDVPGNDGRPREDDAPGNDGGHLEVDITCNNGANNAIVRNEEDIENHLSERWRKQGSWNNCSLGVEDRSLSFRQMSSTVSFEDMIFDDDAFYKETSSFTSCRDPLKMVSPTVFASFKDFIPSSSNVKRSRSVSVSLPLTRSQEILNSEVGQTLRRLSDEFSDKIRQKYSYLTDEEYKRRFDSTVDGAEGGFTAEECNEKKKISAAEISSGLLDE